MSPTRIVERTLSKLSGGRVNLEGVGRVMPRGMSS